MIFVASIIYLGIVKIGDETGYLFLSLMRKAFRNIYYFLIVYCALGTDENLSPR